GRRAAPAPGAWASCGRSTLTRTTGIGSLSWRSGGLAKGSSSRRSRSRGRGAGPIQYLSYLREQVRHGKGLLEELHVLSLDPLVDDYVACVAAHEDRFGLGLDTGDLVKDLPAVLAGHDHIENDKPYLLPVFVEDPDGVVPVARFQGYIALLREDT